MANGVYTGLSSIWSWVNGESRGVFGFGEERAMPVRLSWGASYWRRCPSPCSTVESFWYRPIPSLAPLSFSRRFATGLGDRSSDCAAIVTLKDGRCLKDLYRHEKRGLQVYLTGMDYPLTVSWFWLKRADGKRELRFVASTYPYSGAYLVQVGRKRWAIEGFFKTAKHQFGLHCFGQSTKLGVYRWLILSLIAYLLAHWVDQWSLPPVLEWKTASRLALETLLLSIVWFQLLKQIQRSTDIAAQYGVEIVLKS